VGGDREAEEQRGEDDEADGAVDADAADRLPGLGDAALGAGPAVTASRRIISRPPAPAASSPAPKPAARARFTYQR
jgi:hypothetical protein